MNPKNLKRTSPFSRRPTGGALIPVKPTRRPLGDG